MRNAIAVFFVMLGGLAFSFSGWSATTETVAFQGKVTGPASAPLADGTYAMSFTLFDVFSDGTPLWTETDPATPVVGGAFIRALGSIQAFPANLFSENADLYLEIAIDADANGLDAGDVQSPRTPLNATPVALHAKDAAMLGGTPANDIATSAAVAADLAAVESSLTDALDALSNGVAASISAQAIAISGKADSFELADKISRIGPAHIVAEATDDPLDSGVNLLQAYLDAKALTPNGDPLGPENRAVVVVAPGTYDLGTTQLVLDTNFVDLIGLTTNRESQIITGASNGPGTGVIRQTADFVRIENLSVYCTRASGGTTFTLNDPAAYFPDPDLSSTLIRNCLFLSNDTHAYSMRLQVSYVGTYEDCFAGLYSFGGGGLGGIAGGIFRNCTGNALSFGGGEGGIASGSFFDCSGSFGGNGGTASGTFINCNGFGPSFGGGAGGVASGTFTNCHTVGSDGFGGAGGTASGTFIDCTAGNDSFGGEGGTASGDFIRCTGGNRSFGGLGNASGDFTSCTGGELSFGGGTVADSGQATGNFTDCTGEDFSFGGGLNDLSVDSYLIGCKMTGNWDGVFNGTMENCRWEISIPINVGNSARVYGSTFLAGVNLGNNNAGVTQCRAFGFLNAGNNLFGATNAAAFNISSTEVK